MATNALQTLDDMDLETILTKLTPKERRFAEEYVVNFEARDAAMRLGIDTKVAHRWADRQLKKPLVAKYINLLLEEQANNAKLLANRIRIELARIAFGDITDLVEWTDDGKMVLKSSNELRKAVTATVQDVGIGYGGKVKLKTYDKMQALELLMKHLGMISPKISESADSALDGLVAVLQASRIQAENEIVLEGNTVETIRHATDEPAYLVDEVDKSDT